MGDERCLPEGDAQRNDHMANQSWLSHVPVPGDQLYMIPAQLGAEAGAEHYDAVIRAIDEFDLVLLGLGEDGHTASLFPGQAYDETASVVAVHDAPKPPEDRISLTAAALGKAKHAWFLVSGEGKRTAMQQWLQGDAIPASTIRPDSGIDIHTDIDLDPAGA
jgi:6-phosphogluconolactonase